MIRTLRIVRIPGLAFVRQPVFHPLRTALGALLAIFILMPMDRGFPSISQGGKPLAPVVIFVGLMLAWLMLRGGFLLWGYLRRKYVVYMAGYCLLNIATSFQAGLPYVVTSLQFTATFLGGYLLFLHVAETDEDGMRWLAPWVVIAGCVASIYGAVELFTGFQPAFYKTMFERASATGIVEVGSDLVRGQGTQGNPILAAATVVFCLPFVRDLPARHWRIAACLILLAGAFVTVARTALFPLFVLAIGWLVIERRSAAKWIGPGLAIMVTGVVSVVAIFSENPFISLWLGRLGIGPGASAFAAMNANTRQETVTLAVNAMSNWSPHRYFIGAGANAGASISERVASGLTTLDNTPTTILYERGMASLVLFYAAPLSVLTLFRRRALTNLHWWAVPAQMAMGISFDYEGFSSFNLVVMASLAIATARTLESRLEQEEPA